MITVKDFFGNHIQDYEAELYGIVSNTVLNTTTDEIKADDGLRESWKNAEIECWWIDEDNKSIVMEVYA
jgi:hypothetical protein